MVHRNSSSRTEAIWAAGTHQWWAVIMDCTPTGAMRWNSFGPAAVSVAVRAPVPHVGTSALHGQQKAQV